MAPTSRLLRRRDRYLLTIVAGIAACNVATTALYWFAFRSRLRSSDAHIVAMESRIDDERETVCGVTNAVRVLVDWAARSVESAGVPVAASEAAPEFVGRGITRTVRGRPVLYVDIRKDDGAVERHYLPIQSPLPIPSENDEGSSRASGTDDEIDGAKIPLDNEDGFCDDPSPFDG